MPIFEDFSRTGKLLSVRDEILNETNIDRYIEEHDFAHAKGYIDATKDVATKIHDIIFENENYYRSPATVVRLLKEFLKDRQSFTSSWDNKILNKITTPSTDTNLTP